MNKLKRVKIISYVIVLMLIMQVPSIGSAKASISKPTSVRVVSTSYNSISLSWDKVKGAIGYAVYRATASGGKFSLYKTTTKRIFNNTGLKTGKTYYYKIKAFRTSGNKRIYGSNSSKVSARPIPSVPNSIKIKTTSLDGINVSWSGVKGANGYNVYKSNSETGTFTLVSDTSFANFSDSGLVAGITYYYKVRAYKNIGSVKIFGNFSSIKSGTIAAKIKGFGYVYNPELQVDLNVRSNADINAPIIGHLFNFQKVKILDTIEGSKNLWNKIVYNNTIAYISDAYIQHYTSPADNIVNIAVNITSQFEVGNSTQIAGDSDNQGLSIGYLQWCIGQGTLQTLLHRMDRQYNVEMKNIFGREHYNEIHNMLMDTNANQLVWAKSINDLSNNIEDSWYSQFVILSKDKNFKSIEKDAEVYTVKQAMVICDKYNLKTSRGFALAFDIANQNGSIGFKATEIIDNALLQNPNIAEKDLLKVIANAVSGNSSDVLSRKMAIVDGQGVVHDKMLLLDTGYGLSDMAWR